MRDLVHDRERGVGHLGERHLRQSVDPRIQALYTGRVGEHAVRAVRGADAIANLAQIGAGTEHFQLGADVQHMPVRPLCECVEVGVELIEPLIADGIDRWVVQAQGGDASGDGNADHGFPAAGARAAGDFSSSRAITTFCTSVAPS